MANLKEKYNQELRPALKEELGLSNIMAVPKLTKVVINMGVGEAANDKKHLESALDNLTVISGQKPVVTRARQSVDSFKIREAWPLGCKVTFRGNKMFSGFLFADSREIAQELHTQLYEAGIKTLNGKLEIAESLHFTNVDEYDLSFREEVGYRAWSWLDEKDPRGNDVRISFLKKVKDD